MHLLKYSDFINELKIYKEPSNINGYSFVVYKGTVYFIDDDNYEEISNIILNPKDQKHVGDTTDFMNLLSEEYPYVLSGVYDGDSIFLNKFEHRNSGVSEDLKKLSKMLNTKNIYSNAMVGDDEYNVNVKLEKDLKTASYYHGTSINFFDNIMKVGINPSPQNTNFDNIKHNDKVFITLNKEKALFHSITSARNNNSIPIIMELTIPDVDKLVIDYDLGLDYNTDEYNKKLNYKRLYKYHLSKDRLSDNDRNDIAKTLGIFGYLGRIPSKFIKTIHVDSFFLQNYYFSLSEMGYSLESLGLDYNYNLGIEEVDNWSEFTHKELSNYLEKIIQYGYGEVDEEE